MKPPQLFSGQPTWASVLVLASYMVFGPYMKDDGVEINRPRAALGDVGAISAFWVAVTTLIVVVCWNFFENTSAVALISVVTSTLFTFVAQSRTLVRVLINAYQRRAPAQVRRRCAQTPSCSEYFVLAVEKDGVLKGGRRGWDRLKRCDGTQQIDFP